MRAIIVALSLLLSCCPAWSDGYYYLCHREHPEYVRSEHYSSERWAQGAHEELSFKHADAASDGQILYSPTALQNIRPWVFLCDIERFIGKGHDPYSQTNIVMCYPEPEKRLSIMSRIQELRQLGAARMHDEIDTLIDSMEKDYPLDADDAYRNSMIVTWLKERFSMRYIRTMSFEQRHLVWGPVVSKHIYEICDVTYPRNLEPIQVPKLHL